jgi:hypothetical protein
MRRSRFRWRTLAVLLVLLPGCVQLTGQRISWFYDQAKDELQILIDYDGIHDSGNDAGGKGTEQIPQFVREGSVMLLDWPFQLDMAELRKKAEENGPKSLERDWARLFLSLKTEALGYYHEPDGHVGAVQRITVPRASEFLAKANSLISRQVLDASPVSDGTMARTVQRIRAAAEQGHAWIRLDGQSIRIDVPVHPDEWTGFKTQRLHDVAGYVAKALAPNASADEKAAYPWALQALTSLPISYLEKDDRVEFVLGRVKTPSTWRYQFRSDYEPSLEKVVAQSVKTNVDETAADALLQPNAAASDPVRALLDWGPPEDRVRVLMSTAQGGDAARKTAAIGQLGAWARRWNEEHGVPKAPSIEGGSFDPGAWKKWYAAMRQYPVFMGQAMLNPTPQQGTPPSPRKGADR